MLLNPPYPEETMEKIGPVISNFISANQNALMNKWESNRNSITIWHNGPIDEKMLESINNIVLSLKNTPKEDDRKRIKESKKIDFIVNSTGGSIESAYQSIRLLDKNFPEKNNLCSSKNRQKCRYFNGLWM
jgi:ATP-dependent protease ClpP protease subunit